MLNHVQDTCSDSATMYLSFSYSVLSFKVERNIRICERVWCVLHSLSVDNSN